MYSLPWRYFHLYPLVSIQWEQFHFLLTQYMIRVLLGLPLTATVLHITGRVLLQVP